MVMVNGPHISSASVPYSTEFEISLEILLIFYSRINGFFSIHFANLLQLHATYYTTCSLLHNTTRTIPRSARYHDNSVAINMNNW